MMQTRTHSFVPCFLQLCTFYAIFLTCAHASGKDQHLKEYIVYMGDFKSTLGTPPSVLHSKFLEKALDINSSSASLLYSYNSGFNCFVALLNSDDVRMISSMEEVVSVFPNKNNYLRTTKSWDFMGVYPTIRRAIQAEINVIVGVIDSGIWPESPSFHDAGFGPPPSRWRGSCHGLTNFTCNNKIIGARYYKKSGTYSRKDVKSPRDTNGHGTHVASIIAGNMVNSASYYGMGSGTARGGVPFSRIAVYKVYWSGGSKDADIISAFADAVEDGVDIISISMSNDETRDYFSDPISIGSFKAMRKHILTVSPVGNAGPALSTVSNAFPWVLSVGASTISRKFITNLQLDNAKIIPGDSLNTFSETGFFPVVYGGNAANKRKRDESRMCRAKSLDPKLVQGKIVICDEYNLGNEALSAGAVGMVIHGHSRKDDIESFLLPTTYVFGEAVEEAMRNFIRNGGRANIFKTSEGHDYSAPYITTFSSRGPNPITPEILKPDLCAPGDKILGAWSPVASPTKEEVDTRRVHYNIISGSSSACPHVTAAAAYVKSFNPSFSAAAIKSALITTAVMMNSTKNYEAEFAYGAGHINPSRAISPGLVYDAELDDYMQFLCGQGYTKLRLARITGDDISCSNYGRQTNSNLNMPSFSIPVPHSTHFSVTLRRRVTNKGSLSYIYNAEILSPPTLKIRVVPDRLVFSSVGQTLPFTLTVEGIINGHGLLSASLKWVGSQNVVRSPIVVFSSVR